MQIVVVGINHKSAPLPLLERVSVAPERLDTVLHRVREEVEEGLVLSTCNRVELYAVCGHEESGADVLRRLLAEFGGVDVGRIRAASYAHGHRTAIRHAMRVAGGLDSMVVGESEIQGQVRRALQGAQRAGSIGPVLDRLGSAALACGKRVRSETGLGRNAESVGSIAVQLAGRQRGPLRGSRVVVIGAGETAALVLDDLALAAPSRITIVNRTPERAAALATAHDAAWLPWGRLHDALADADVVLACTASPSPLLDATTLAAARAGAGGRPLLCVDLGVPRDIDPAVASLPGVTLIDVQAVDAEASARHVTRAHDVERAEAIVAEETERYLAWWQGRGVSATIARLHARAAAIRDAELDRALARLPDLSPRERLVVGELATRIASKLLHEPTLALKREPEGANMALVVERLFALALTDLARDEEHDPVLALHAMRRERREEGIAS